MIEQFINVLLLLFSTFYSYSLCLPDKGTWSFTVSEERIKIISVLQTLFKDSQISLQISCEPLSRSVKIDGILINLSCWMGDTNQEDGILEKLKGSTVLDDLQKSNSSDISIKFPKKNYFCSNFIILNARNSFTVSEDGIYRLLLRIELEDAFNETVAVKMKGTVHIKMRGTHGYLSAAEWPLLPFYRYMCMVYLLFAFMWLIMSFLQWRDLLRIQFWIGAVIFIGMMEKALFYEVYQTTNSTGELSLPGTVLVAELVSAGKRTLARMLVIIVSLGYGIVKPRLGSHFPKVISIGAIYFILASVEAYLRIMRTRNIQNNSLLIASISLALLDSFICWWIFSSLIQTTRTLRLRRNLVKLTLYNNFTKTLIFTVVASTIFMLYSIIVHRAAACLTDWKELWMEDAYWHLLFSIILLVIMILWRPTNNNRRYAFSPLLDALDDEDEENEEIEHFVNDSYGSTK